jgi:hypothetical protein
MKIRKRNRLRLRAARYSRPWRSKRERQAKSLASGVDGSWFRNGMTRRWSLTNAPY